MTKINEQQAYNEYVKACHSVIGEFVSEFNFLEWRAAGRPKTQYVKDGYWPTPWDAEREYNQNVAPCDDAEFGMKP